MKIGSDVLMMQAEDMSFQTWWSSFLAHLVQYTSLDKTSKKTVICCLSSW